MRMEVLGPLRLRAGSRTLSVTGAKRRALLGALLLCSGRPVSMDHLLEALWEVAPPNSAVANVRTHVSYLRKLFARQGDGGVRLEQQDSGYLLDIDGCDLDLARFKEMAAQGDIALEDGEAAEAAQRFAEAMALWRGDPLEGLELQAWAQAKIIGLLDRYWSVESGWVDAQILCGRYQDAVSRGREIVARWPYRERGWSQLMVALYQSGRRVDALETFQQARETFVDGLGLDPERRLQRLHQALLAGVAVGWQDGAWVSADDPGGAPQPSTIRPGRRALQAVACNRGRAPEALAGSQN